MQMKRNQVRKGMVMLDPSVNPTACWEFEGDILVLHHPTTISPKYQAMGEWVGEGLVSLLEAFVWNYKLCIVVFPSKYIRIIVI